MGSYRIKKAGCDSDPRWQWVLTVAEHRLSLSVSRITAMNQLVNYLLAASALTLTLGVTVISRRPGLFLHGIHMLYYLAGASDLLSLGLLLGALVGFSTVNTSPRPLALWREVRKGSPTERVARLVAAEVELAIGENADQVAAKGRLASYAMVAILATLVLGSAALITGSGGGW